MKSWQASAGVYFPIGDLHNTSGNKIFTEADLVNLKKEYSGHDQSRPEASESRPAAHPDNGRVVGAVSEETAKTLHLDNPGAIVLDDAGMRHIEERHSEEIRSLGFKDGREFVNCVLENLNAVHDVDGHGRKYDLVSKARTSQGRIMVRLEFAKDGDFYQVVTAKAVRENHFDKKTPLWESAGCAQM